MRKILGEIKGDRATMVVYGKGIEFEERDAPKADDPAIIVIETDEGQHQFNWLGTFRELRRIHLNRPEAQRRRKPRSKR